MIRRDAGDDWLLISQIDHAHLAAEIASVWGNDDIEPLPMADLLVPAIRDHDEGWRAWESAPQIDPNLGWPRNFTEMPMQDATEIWSKSIDICAHGGSVVSAARAKFRQFLRVKRSQLTKTQRTIFDALVELDVFDVVVDLDVPFDEQFLRDAVSKLGYGKQFGREAIRRTLSYLEQAGIVHIVQQTGDEDTIYETIVPTQRASSLAGSWVSRHFCWLAEKAQESRTADPEESNAVEQFLAMQQKRQLWWISNPGFTTTHARFNELSRNGFRWVQFFDRLSLWICCAKRTEPFDVTSPDGVNFTWIPCRSNKFIIDPFPLSIDVLPLSVSALHIPARFYADDEELQMTMRDAGMEELTWVISR